MDKPLNSLAVSISSPPMLALWVEYPSRCLDEAASDAEALITIVPTPMASLVHDRFVAALAQGLGDADWSAIARVSYRNAGL